jgi:hypothetical protein
VSTREASEEWSDRIAALAVDGLVTAGIVKRDQFERAVAIVAEEILVRLSLTDYPPRDALNEINDLTPEENLILRVAVATCFAFPFKSAEIPPDDVERYVTELIKLYNSKPNARTGDPDRPDLRSTISFCADRLASAAPAQAARLRSAIGTE